MISQLLSFLLIIAASAATAAAPYPNIPPAHPLPPVVCNGTTLCLDVDEGVKDYCSIPDDPMCSPCWDNCTHHSEYAVLHCWEVGSFFVAVVYQSACSSAADNLVVNSN